ncbi:MAG TPA: S8 family serine peptidase [Frankiaceae bacterium]|nr:S8 family serine peptidase [Frankiaceae bacterium]
MGRGAKSLAGLAVAAFALLSTAGPAAAVTGSWSDQLADLVGAGPLAGNGRGVTVAVLDTWVDVTHPDFGGRVSRGVTCTGTRCVPGADQPDTCDPHGTHVTGIIASSRYGVAPLVKVVPIRVLTSATGSCAANAEDVALGIRYAIAHHIELINVSLGSTFPLADPRRVLPAAVTAAKKAGDLVIVAAGNGKAAAASTYGPDALTVAALGPDGSIASYSQRGKGVDIAAPGGDAAGGSCNPADCIVSTWEDGGYASDAGTSMAAPFVSGTAALLLSQDPHRTVAQVRQIILSTARPFPLAGAGRLDILAAVRGHAGVASTTLAPTGAPSAIHTAAPSITPAPGAGLPPRPSSSQAPAEATPRSSSSSSSKIKFGPVQLLGILIVGGVTIAFVSVSGQRGRRN